MSSPCSLSSEIEALFTPRSSNAKRYRHSLLVLFADGAHTRWQLGLQLDLVYLVMLRRTSA
ncbi:MAG: hypothetical protein FJ390_05300 [Verrucomicrobia bacterium]|nr:hypothetical protein [Verrucomicrobiota bacterium]